jgi:hypothetical protein
MKSQMVRTRLLNETSGGAVRFGAVWESGAAPLRVGPIPAMKAEQVVARIAAIKSTQEPNDAQ